MSGPNSSTQMIIVARLDGGVSDRVQLEDPVLLQFEVRVVRSLERLDHLKRHALLTEQDPKALMADVVDHPLSDQELSQLRQAPGRERQAVILGSRQRDLLDVLALRQRERRRAATCVLRSERVEPVGVEVVVHLAHPVRRRERDLSDLLDRHALRGPQHDLGSSPPHDRPRLTPDDLQQVSWPSCGARSLTKTRSAIHQGKQIRPPQWWTRDPPTLPVTALGVRQTRRTSDRINFATDLTCKIRIRRTHRASGAHPRVHRGR